MWAGRRHHENIREGYREMEDQNWQRLPNISVRSSVTTLAWEDPTLSVI